MKSSCQGGINMVKWKGVDKKRKGGVSNGIYRNFIFNNRHINMYKSFIKIKINQGVIVMIEIVYKFNGEEFKEDDLIQVIRQDTFTGERSEITGRMIKSLFNNEIKLDISTRYNSEIITININEIIKINKIQ